MTGITYRTHPLGPHSDFSEALEAHLFARGARFRGWFQNPRKCFRQGGIAVRARAGDHLVGVAILKHDPEDFAALASLLETCQTLVGCVGFFVAPKHRHHGIAAEMARRLEAAVLRRYPARPEPVLACGGAARAVVASGFRSLKTISFEAAHGTSL